MYEIILHHMASGEEVRICKALQWRDALIAGLETIKRNPGWFYYLKQI